MERFIIHYEKTAGTHSSAFPHVLDTLKRAREAGLKQAVVTNKESRFTARVLEQHGLIDAFDMIISGDSLPVKKPNPAVIDHCLAQMGLSAGEALFVGDSEIDVATAKSAGVVCWAVNYGYNLGRPIEDAKPDRVISDIRDVPSFFRTL
jgi:phosphoglycolate phosphatase